MSVRNRLYIGILVLIGGIWLLCHPPILVSYFKKVNYPTYLPGTMADLYPELRQAVADARQRCVSVETESWKGSGFYARADLVVTNFHILEEGSAIWIDGKEGGVANVDPKNALAILRISKAERVLPPIVFADHAEPGQIVFHVGSPLEEHPCAVFFGTVLAVNADEIVTDTPAMSGMSGSALYTADGKLLGVQTWGHDRDKRRMHVEAVSMAVPVGKIRKLLEGMR